MLHLDDYLKGKLLELYYQYFYHRHDIFWKKEALRKLPALKEATDMMVCGEDLGMVPASVPGVMQRLGILSLDVQRMPKFSFQVIIQCFVRRSLIHRNAEMKLLFF